MSEDRLSRSRIGRGPYRRGTGGLFPILISDPSPGVWTDDRILFKSDPGLFVGGMFRSWVGIARVCWRAGTGGWG
ncbi:hypothetical protein GCM10023085_50200 [Actinomadura viridis]